MNAISDNLLAAFFERKTSASDTLKVLKAAVFDPEIRKVIELSFEMDDEVINQRSILPLAAVAANEKENRCAGMCELYVLKANNIEKTLEDWEKQVMI